MGAVRLCHFRFLKRDTRTPGGWQLETWGVRRLLAAMCTRAGPRDRALREVVAYGAGRDLDANPFQSIALERDAGSKSRP